MFKKFAQLRDNGNSNGQNGQTGQDGQGHGHSGIGATDAPTDIDNDD